MALREPASNLLAARVDSQASSLPSIYIPPSTMAMNRPKKGYPIEK